MATTYLNRALICVFKENAHDCEDARIEALDALISDGLARVETNYRSYWGGKYHSCREVGLTPEGIQRAECLI